MKPRRQTPQVGKQYKTANKGSSKTRTTVVKDRTTTVVKDRTTDRGTVSATTSYTGRNSGGTGNLTIQTGYIDLRFVLTC
jgi:hypothetical protein